MSYLQINELRKTYGGTKVIEGLSFAVEQGTFVSLLGASGSGKTTILRCIAGLEMPDDDSGSLRLAGHALSEGKAFVPPEKREIGMVFQNYAVWPHLDVFENVAFPLRVQRQTADDVERRVGEALTRVRLNGLERRYAHELSGGQQQRVALARALVATPRLLLLDEPLSNLDALLREELATEIRRLQKELGLTAILVTHDQKEALSLSDRILVLERGKIAADGAPEALYANPPSDFVAEFLAGAQRLRDPDGVTRTYLPRRWRVDATGRHDAKILARIFRGSEYEYVAAVDGFAEPLRFFGPDRRDMGDTVKLSYLTP